MLSTGVVVKGCNNNEDKILEYMNENSILVFDKDILTAISLLDIFIENDLLDYNFNMEQFAEIKEEDQSELINTFSNFIEAWLLYVNNTVAFYYFAKKVGFNKIVKKVEDKINFLTTIFEGSEEINNLDYLQKLEEFAKLVPDILIFASRKGYEFNSVKKAEELNKKFLKSK